MTAPDFTFAADKDLDRKDLQPMYRAILGPGPRPKVSLGPVTRAAATAWLERQHDRYKDGLAGRSHLIQNMRLQDRVELVDLADG